MGRPCGAGRGHAAPSLTRNPPHVQSSISATALPITCSPVCATSPFRPVTSLPSTQPRSRTCPSPSRLLWRAGTRRRPIRRQGGYRVARRGGPGYGNRAGCAKAGARRPPRPARDPDCGELCGRAALLARWQGSREEQGAAASAVTGCCLQGAVPASAGACIVAQPRTMTGAGSCQSSVSSNRRSPLACNRQTEWSRNGAGEAARARACSG